MRAVVITEPGGPEVLGLREVPRPAPGPGEVGVRVCSGGVNRADLIQRRGRYPAPPGWPAEIPGLEYAGVVEEVGEGARLWSEGDRVMGLVGGGAYAEHVVVHERTPVRVPEGAALEVAGAVPEVFMAAYDALLLQARLGLGETLLIHAVGSGVGTAAVQMARSAGAWSVGTSRTPEKVDRATALGLSVGVVAEGEGWADRVMEALRGRGADVILDLVGGSYLAPNQELLASGGRHVVVGVPGGSRSEIDLRALMGKRGRIRGTVLRARPLEEKAALAREFQRRIVPLFEAGALEPVVDRIFGPGDVAEAHRVMEENRNFGKLVIRWNGD